MRILHISGATGWGGNEQQLVSIISELNKIGLENIVFGVDQSILQQECIVKGIAFRICKSNKLNRFANYFYLKKVVSELKPDLIHLHTSDSITVFTISDFLRNLKIKAVFSKKGMGISSSFFSKLKYNYKNVVKTICVSKSVEVNFSKILNASGKKKTTVIHDCIPLSITNEIESLNLREAYNIPENWKVIGNIANHSLAKDLETLINTVDVLVKKHKRTDFVVLQIGTFSKLTPKLVDMIKEKKLEKNIILTNSIKNAYTLNKQFDLFLMTSEREGGPTSVLEAMLFGVPVVSTNVGVISELIVNGENGFIAEPKDAVSLAGKLHLLLNNTELKMQFSEKSKSIVEREFNAEHIAMLTYKTYKELRNL